MILSAPSETILSNFCELFEFCPINFIISIHKHLVKFVTNFLDFVFSAILGISSCWLSLEIQKSIVCLRLVWFKNAKFFGRQDITTRPTVCFWIEINEFQPAFEKTTTIIRYDVFWRLGIQTGWFVFRLAKFRPLKIFFNCPLSSPLPPHFTPLTHRLFSLANFLLIHELPLTYNSPLSLNAQLIPPHTQTLPSHTNLTLTHKPYPHTQTLPSHTNLTLTHKPYPHTQTLPSHTNLALTHKPYPNTQTLP